MSKPSPTSEDRAKAAALQNLRTGTDAATQPEDEQRQGEPISSTSAPASPSTAAESHPGTSTSDQMALGKMSASELVVETALVLGEIKAMFPPAAQPAIVERAKLLLIEMGARAAAQWAKGEVVSGDPAPGLANIQVEPPAKRPPRTDIRKK